MDSGRTCATRQNYEYDPHDSDDPCSLTLTIMLTSLVMLLTTLATSLTTSHDLTPYNLSLIRTRLLGPCLLL